MSFDLEENDYLNDPEIVRNVFGSGDENISIIEDAFNVRIMMRDGGLSVVSEDPENAQNAEKAEAVLKKLADMSAGGERITRQLTAYVCDLAAENGMGKADHFNGDAICTTAQGRPVKAKTAGQKEYVDLMEKDPVVFAIGPAGTGKTYLAVAKAVSAFKNNEVTRIILTRPAVEAGEKLGFLPGDLQNKVDPYLRPLYDALYDIMGADSYMRHLERGAIEIAPLAYMRGRTLDNAFIILDEAQNTTGEQLKMFLTRLGQNSRAVVTGDITQIDLPPDKMSGLKQIPHILKNIPGVGFVYLTDKDVVRHELVQRIIRAYEEYGKRQAEKARERKERKGNEKDRS